MKIEEERKNVEHDIIKLYKFGSVIYGTSNEQSDEDYIAVVYANPSTTYNVRGETDYIVYSEDSFIKAIKEHKIDALECILLNEEDEYRKHFNVDKALLRKEVSSVASNSYVKCKKKLQDGETYIGLKSLFHSLRILDYGIQIAKYGTIKDYKKPSHHFNDIIKTGNDWETLHKHYKPIYNNLKTEFKKLCPL